MKISNKIIEQVIFKMPLSTYENYGSMIDKLTDGQFDESDLTPKQKKYIESKIKQCEECGLYFDSDCIGYNDEGMEVCSHCL